MEFVFDHLHFYGYILGDHSAGLGTDENEDADEIGGLFRVVSKTQERILKEKDNEDALDSSKFQIIQMSDWNSPEVEVFFLI